MTLEEIEKEVIKFCKLENIPMICGRIEGKDNLEKVKKFLVILKRQYKYKRTREKMLGTPIKDVLRRNATKMA